MKHCENLQSVIEEKFLPFVEHPVDYIGGEMNSIQKSWEKADIKIAIGFPDTYRIGMGSLAIQIIYHFLNSMDDVLCERVFCPWIDASTRMRKEGIPLFSLESFRPIKSFDIFAISVPYEMLYTNVIEMLDLAGISIWSKNRTDDDPLIIAGGAQMHNPEPLAEIIDLAVIGEAEATLPLLLDAYKELKLSKCPRQNMIMELAKRFDWVYAPSLYNADYHSDGSIKEIKPICDGIPQNINRKIVSNLEETFFPTAPIVPYADTVHKRINIEIMRGCPNNCRFCHEGYTRKPVRKRSPEKILQLAEASVQSTGLDEISLCSLSSADYPNLAELFLTMNKTFAPRHISIALPSLRIQDQLKIIPEQTSQVRKAPITIALEAGSERLRSVLNKDIDLSNLKPAVIEAYRCGWRQVKLYFMIGIPGETEDDLREIVTRSKEISDWGYEAIGRPAMVSVSISFLVPKPQTPFQWSGQKSIDYFRQSVYFIKDIARPFRNIRIKYHDWDRSRLEAIFARGDRRLSKVLFDAWKAGARFDAWDETFKFDYFATALSENNLDADFYACRTIGFDEILSWQHIRVGHDKEFLKRQWMMSESYIKVKTEALPE